MIEHFSNRNLITNRFEDVSLWCSSDYKGTWVSLG